MAAKWPQIFAATVALIATANHAMADTDTPPTPPALSDKEILDTAVNKPGPKYPDAAYEADIEGYVVMEIVIAPDGQVTSVKVIKAEPPGWFEDAAVTAVKQWRYRPPGRVIVAKVHVDFEIPPELKLPADSL